MGPQTVHPQPEAVLKGRQVFLINEGNFQHGNASLSAYNPHNKTVQHQIFSSFNNNIPLGDVAQDIQEFNGRYYIVMNNSGMVRVVDTTTWTLIGDISGLQTPRYIAFAEDHAFVTDLYAKKLWLLNTDQMQLEKSLDLPAPGFHITYWNKRIVVGLQNNQIAIVNPKTLQTDSLITLSRGVECMKEDHNDNLWILCTKSTTNAQLIALDKNWQVIQNFTFSPTVSPHYLEINKTRDTLIFAMEDGIYKQAMSVASSFPSAKQLIPLNGQNLYGLSVDPLNGDIYFYDALDYNQASDIYRYNNKGKLIHQFKGGVITNAILF